MMRDVHICVLCRSDLQDPVLGRVVLDAVFASHSDFFPSRFGNFEPLRAEADRGRGLDQFMGLWAHPFLWTQGKRCEGSIWFGNGKRHSAVTMSFMSSRVDGRTIVNLVSELSCLLSADFASAYVVFEDRERAKRRYKAVRPMIIGPFTVDLQRSIPDLPWLSVFGPPYVELFGRDRILTCPAFQVKELQKGCWSLQIADQPSSCREDPDEYERRRDQAKEHLGLDCFLDLADPDSQRRAPAFAWATTPKSFPPKIQ
jgi:hypothetical protein